MKTPISIISGYLGSGKTTLLRNILKNAKEKIAIIMNEFGEIDIDSKIIKGKNVNISELSGGCVCCSLTGEFELAIKEIIQKYNPDLIVVETTGLAEPDALIFDIENELPDVKLDSIITVVDSDAFFRFPLGKTGKIQIELADIILINKIDLLKENKLKELEEKVKELNKNAVLIKTKFCNVNNYVLFGLYSEKNIEKSRYHVHLDIDFFSFETTKNINKQRFIDFIKKIPKEIFRSKGFIKLDNQFYLFNYVAQRYSLEEFKSDKTQLVFIGEKIKKFEKEVKKE